mgnify:CR=1 FL=1|tara:strand:- start:2489 stop:2590 length:102 start_codon:yes stop_codon:yes gene_type:complete
MPRIARSFSQFPLTTDAHAARRAEQGIASPPRN